MTSAVYPYSGPYWSTDYYYSGRIQAGVLTASTAVDFFGVEAFNITSGSGNDTLYGGANNDRLVGGAGNDILYGGSGIDTIDGGTGTDTWQADFTAYNDNVTINLVKTTQVAPLGVTVSGIEQLIVSTNYSAGDDVITAKTAAFNDIINTYGGDDTITTGRGVDNVDAGTGNDTLVMNWGAVTTNINAVTLTPTYPYDGSNGYYGNFTSVSGDSLTFSGVEIFKLTGGSGNDTLTGGRNDDSLSGGIGNDILSGGEGVDTLSGGEGDDWLDSGTGKATIDGGAGNDIWKADLSSILAGLVVSAATSQTTAQGTAAGHSIRNIEGFNFYNGLGKDKLNSEGYALNDIVYANGGDDEISLGLGFDTALGGAGTDTLTVDYSSLTSDISSTVTSLYDPFSGWATNAYVMADKLNTASISYGNFEKHILRGGSGNDTLIGGSDVDTLIGNAGNDVLSGGAGKDIIDGGTGNDTWVGDQSAATTAIKLILAATGNGSLTSTTSSNVTSNVVSLTGIEAVVLITGSKNDIIDTSAVRGNDSVRTGEGDDIVRLGDGNDYADGGAGNDTLVVNFSSSTTVIRSVYGSSYYDTAKLNVINYSSFEVLDMTGGSANDRLTGYYGDDKINGGAGNDIINGDSGNDTLTGGAGNDIFDYSVYWAAGVDTITDASVGDSIRINYFDFTGGSVVLGDGTLIGYQVQLSVNTVNNQSTLHIANNALQIKLTGIYSVNSFTLDGRYIKFTEGSTNVGTLGNDTLIGTIGADVLSGGTGNDSLTGNDGNDLLDGGADNDTITGDAGNDTITGGTGDDLLTGGLGADNLTGGTGADKFIYTSIFESTPGTPFHDVINDFSVAELDKIDLSAIDANSAAAGNQAFSFIKTGFTGTAGQVRFDATAGLVLADTNGDSLVDLEIQVLGSPVITASSFVL